LELLKTDHYLFLGALALYAVAAILFAVAYFGRAELPRKLAMVAVGVGALIQLSQLGLRSHIAQFPPFASLYAIGSSVAFGMILLFLISHWIWKVSSYGLFTMWPVLSLMCYLLTVESQQIDTAAPALRNGPGSMPTWYIWVHVPFSIVGYGSFAVAAGLALAWVFEHMRARRLDKYGTVGAQSAALPYAAAVGTAPKAATLELIIFKLTGIGWLMQTILIIMGAVWAGAAWGKMWSWDLKEIVACVPWLTATIALHGRTQRSWQPLYTALFGIVNLFGTMFTLVLWNYLPSQSLHKYAPGADFVPGLLFGSVILLPLLLGIVAASGKGHSTLAGLMFLIPMSLMWALPWVTTEPVPQWQKTLSAVVIVGMWVLVTPWMVVRNRHLSGS
jgi:ABC-type transport system involved in cytochrome c biogenesis permease subunit